MSGSFVVVRRRGVSRHEGGPRGLRRQLSEEASNVTLVKSELRIGINKILQFITYLLWPAGLLTSYTQLFTTDVAWRERCWRWSERSCQWCPRLVLMTSIAFAVGVVRLCRRQCLVNELPAIEGLASVDVVCADNAGTLTENVCWVIGSQEARRTGRRDHPGPAGLRTMPGRTPASRPSRRHTDAAGLDRHRDRTPFKSSTKWSGASYGEHGNWVIGIAHRRAARADVRGAEEAEEDRVAGTAGAAARLE